MDKIAFFYKLGYRMALEKNAQFGLPFIDPEAFSEYVGGFQNISPFEDMEDLMKFIRMNKKRYPKLSQTLEDSIKARTALVRVPRASSAGSRKLLTKILVPTIPAAALAGLGYGAYRMTRPKSKIKRIRKTLGLG